MLPEDAGEVVAAEMGNDLGPPGETIEGVPGTGDTISQPSCMYVPLGLPRKTRERWREGGRFLINLLSNSRLFCSTPRDSPKKEHVVQKGFT